MAASAYRAASKLICARTGIIHDYRKKKGVKASFILAPDDCRWITDRNTLWDAVEAAETRKNSTTAREWLVALPDALDALQRADLTRKLAVELVNRFGVAVDVAIHDPSKQGDNRNHHAHLLTTTRKAGADGFGEKTRILDAAKTGGVEIANMREWWAGAVNDALAKAQSPARVDHRRKSVIAAEARAEAVTLEKQAVDVLALNGKTADLGGIWKGLGHTMRTVQKNGLAALTSTTTLAAKLRAQARDLRTKAEELSKPLNHHHGPKLTSFFRRMEPVWKKAGDEAEAMRQQARNEAHAKEVLLAREEEARLASERIIATRKADAVLLAQRRKDYAEWIENMASEYKERIQPLIARARVDPTFAALVERHGINLNRSDHDVARDEKWISATSYNTDWIYEALAKSAVRLDREAREASDRARQEAEWQKTRETKSLEPSGPAPAAPPPKWGGGPSGP